MGGGGGGGVGVVGLVMVDLVTGILVEMAVVVVGRDLGQVWEHQEVREMETNRVVVSSLQNTENHLHPTHPHPHSCPTHTPILTLTHTLTHIHTHIHIPIPTHPRPPSPGPGPGHPAHTQRPTNPSLGQRARRRR